MGRLSHQIASNQSCRRKHISMLVISIVVCFSLASSIPWQNQTIKKNHRNPRELAKIDLESCPIKTINWSTCMQTKLSKQFNPSGYLLCKFPLFICTTQWSRHLLQVIIGFVGSLFTVFLFLSFYYWKMCTHDNHIAHKYLIRKFSLSLFLS